MGDFDWKTENFKIKGFRDLYKAIDHLPDVVLKKELEPLMIDALVPMMVTAIRLAPDDPLTGPPWNLPTSITISTRQRSGRAKRDRAMGRYSARAYMGPTKEGYPQAVFAEFGTTQRFWKEPGATKSTGLMVATPYMRPAWDAEKYNGFGIIRDGIVDRINMIIRKYGAKG